MTQTKFASNLALGCEPVESSPEADAGTSWQWLEEPQGAKGLEWAKHETQITQQHLDALPRAHEMHQKLENMIEKNAAPPTYALCGRLFRLRRDAVRKSGIIEVAGLEIPHEWTTVIDIDDLREREGKSWQLSQTLLLCFSSVYLGGESSRLLLGLSEGGSDETTIREFDVDKAAWVPGGFAAGPGRFSAAWLDLDHVMITHALDGGPTCNTGWPLKTYIWARGTDLSEAKLVHSGDPGDAILYCSAVGTGQTRRGLIGQAATFADLKFHTVSLDGAVERASLPQDLSLAMFLPSTSTHLFVTTTEESTIGKNKIPKDALLAWNYIDGQTRTSVVYVPEPGEAILDAVTGGISAGSSKVYFTLLKRNTERRVVMEYVNDEWKLCQTVSTPTGASAKVQTADPYSENIIVETSGLLTPKHICLENAGGSRKTDLYSQKPAFDHSNCVVETQVATSKDGTEIDYFIMAPKKHQEKLPVLITGYGAFGMNFDLSYVGPMLGGLSLALWLELGGALVVPLIRGGGERGEDWHQAALRENRQRSYDDFTAVAEAIVGNGLTSPQKLGVFGFSNGGLLAAVMGTQRPDLFGAVVSDVPLTDMLRFPELAMGSAWLNEYGDPQVPEQAKALRAYSPFHNIERGVVYPPMLITCSTLDDRVGVGHSRKLVARLKEVESPKTFLYEETEGGHGVSDNLMNPALMARRLAFFIDNLH
jgi:prolyl oligopeptidase